VWGVGVGWRGGLFEVHKLKRFPLLVNNNNNNNIEEGSLCEAATAGL